ncbi:MAG: hypothetical protein A3K65_03525 [Euryarchaeota archaeon RBG_16_68_12]|nr:MAG: hypothetical protein A3K65_03525 [Euryarchaeota archaeon RBG_16_68_12]
MARALIVGPRDRLAPTIEVLHSMRLLHIVDHHEGEESFHIGKPLPEASDLSDSLVKLRSISAILAVEGPPKEREAVSLTELRRKILALELNITEEDAARKKIEVLLGDLERRAEELRPFAGLGLPLDDYRGYGSLAVLVGRVAREVSDFETAFPQSEVFRAPGAVAVFVPKAQAEDAAAALGQFGYSSLEVPKDAGGPSALLRTVESDGEKWRARLEEVRGRLEKLRERYAGFVVAAQEVLAVEVEKAEAPLRFAVSEHSFVVDGWVPAARSHELASRLSGTGVHVESGEAPKAHGAADPPVLLKNPKPARPFEFLIHLYSTPSYHELDPTVFMLVAYPFFFGFMIGDAGYGLLFFLLGMIAVWKLPKESDFRNLLIVIAVGGFWALVFGLFVYGEMFGMPFHLPPGAPAEELAWDTFGLNYPLQALIHKSLDLWDMIYLSILFATLHLGTSFVIGFVNEVRHNKRHALAKLGWFLCLFGIFTILTFRLSWTQTGGWVWRVALSWFPRTIEPLGISGLLGVQVPLVSLGLIFCAFLGFGESPVAPLEVGGLVANVMSYARLAAIGVGKAAIATAFNTLILHNFIIEHDVGSAIVGYILLVLAQLLVFVLGGISAGIQGLRLNYVESFTKFYKGNGMRFVPFGTRKPQEA